MVWPLGYKTLIQIIQIPTLQDVKMECPKVQGCTSIPSIQDVKMECPEVQRYTCIPYYEDYGYYNMT